MATNAQTSKARTEKYQLVSGKHASGKFNDDGTEIVNVPGDWLELTEAQAKSFGNKVKSQRVLKAELASFQAHEALFKELDEANADAQADQDEEIKPEAPIPAKDGAPAVTKPSTATQTTGAVGKPDPAVKQA